MAQTTFRSEISKGTGFEDSITWSMIAHDTSIAIYGPVVLAAPANNVTTLPRCASTTTAGDVTVIGVCVALPQNGTITADTSIVGVCVFGRCKVKVLDANVSLNAALDCSGTAGQARVQPQLTVRQDSAAHAAADAMAGLNNIRSAFAIALTTVSSGASSIIACYVNINCVAGNVLSA